MLKIIRNSANNIGIKIFFSIIIIAMVWSIGDFSKKFSNEDLAIIGGTFKVTRNEFELAKKNEVERLKSFLGNLTENQIAELNIVVLKKLINNKLIDAEIEDQKILISDHTIAKYIKNDPMFKDDNNKFSDDKFHTILNNNKILERQYINLLKRDVASHYLISGILNNEIKYPNLNIEINEYSNQERSVDIISLNVSDIDYTDDINENEIIDHYAEFKNNFINPESRSFDLVNFDISDFNKNIIYTEAEILEEYNSSQDLYQVEETRNIYNIVFKEEKLAENFYKSLQKNSKEYLNFRDHIMKNITRSDLPLELREIAFKTSKGKHSEVIKTPFGFHILIIDDIIPAHIENFIDVKDIIKEAVVKRKSEEILLKYLDKIENEISSGTKISDIAEKYNLKIEKFDKIIRGNPNNKIFNNFPIIEDMIFSSDIDAISNIVQNQNKYFLFSVTDIRPQNISEFDKVKDSIKSNIVFKRKSELSEIKLRKLQSDFSYNNIGKEFSIKTINIKEYKKEKQFPHMEEKFLEDIFDKKKCETTDIYTKDNKVFFAHIKNIRTSASDTDYKINEELKNDFTNLVSEEYINYLSKKHKVKIINQTMDF